MGLLEGRAAARAGARAIGGHHLDNLRNGQAHTPLMGRVNISKSVIRLLCLLHSFLCHGLICINRNFFYSYQIEMYT